MSGPGGPLDTIFHVDLILVYISYNSYKGYVSLECLVDENWDIRHRVLGCNLSKREHECSSLVTNFFVNLYAI